MASYIVFYPQSLDYVDLCVQLFFSQDLDVDYTHQHQNKIRVKLDSLHFQHNLKLLIEVFVGNNISCCKNSGQRGSLHALESRFGTHRNALVKMYMVVQEKLVCRGHPNIKAWTCWRLDSISWCHAGIFLIVSTAGVYQMCFIPENSITKNELNWKSMILSYTHDISERMLDKYFGGIASWTTRGILVVTYFHSQLRNSCAILCISATTPWAYIIEAVCPTSTMNCSVVMEDAKRTNKKTNKRK